MRRRGRRQEKSQDASTTPSNYNRNKSWGAPKQGEAHCKLVDGVAHSFCSRCNGGKGRWVTDHSTNYHNAKNSDSNWTLVSLAKLQPQHPLLTMVLERHQLRRRLQRKRSLNREEMIPVETPSTVTLLQLRSNVSRTVLLLQMPRKLWRRVCVRWVWIFNRGVLALAHTFPFF